MLCRLALTSWNRHKPSRSPQLPTEPFDASLGVDPSTKRPRASPSSPEAGLNPTRASPNSPIASPKTFRPSATLLRTGSSPSEPGWHSPSPDTPANPAPASQLARASSAVPALSAGQKQPPMQPSEASPPMTSSSAVSALGLSQLAAQPSWSAADSASLRADLDRLMPESQPRAQGSPAKSGRSDQAASQPFVVPEVGKVQTRHSGALGRASEALLPSAGLQLAVRSAVDTPREEYHLRQKVRAFTATSFSSLHVAYALDHLVNAHAVCQCQAVAPLSCMSTSHKCLQTWRGFA